MNCGIESILKKGRAQAIATDVQSSSERPRRRRNDAKSSDHGAAPRKSNGCGNSRRVLFKNNVSVYCFDAESPHAQSDAVPGRRPNGIRSNGGHSPDAVVRPPTSSSSHDPAENRCLRRPTAAELDDRNVNGQLNFPQRRTDKFFADNNSSSSTAVVGNFEVHVNRIRSQRLLAMDISRDVYPPKAMMQPSPPFLPPPSPVPFPIFFIFFPFSRPFPPISFSLPYK